jgi:hypothetical protein
VPVCQLSADGYCEANSHSLGTLYASGRDVPSTRFFTFAVAIRCPVRSRCKPPASSLLASPRHIHAHQTAACSRFECHCIGIVAILHASVCAPQSAIVVIETSPLRWCAVREQDDKSDRGTPQPNTRDGRREKSAVGAGGSRLHAIAGVRLRQNAAAVLAQLRAGQGDPAHGGQAAVIRGARTPRTKRPCGRGRASGPTRRSSRPRSCPRCATFPSPP